MTARERREALVRLDMAVGWVQAAMGSLGGRALLEAQAAIRCLEAARQAVQRRDGVEVAP
jgi:hypothetical protein